MAQELAFAGRIQQSFLPNEIPQHPHWDFAATLIRTYAMQFPDEPGKALQYANERILSDTESDQFVTVFYGVLDLGNGRLTYANAGHNPTYHLGSKVKSLGKTGIPLGMFKGMVWEQETIQISVGENLILYSDGVPEAQNSQQAEFGDERLLAIAQQ